VRRLSILSLLASGCIVENPPTVTDTTGAELGWTCDRGSCTTEIIAGSPGVPSMCGEDTELLVGAGALAILCAVSVDAGGSDVVHERTCRPLACADDLDCPQWEARGYGCLNDVCQIAGRRLDRIDLAALCLWDLPRHTSCTRADADTEIDRRLALRDGVCSGDDCDTVPPGCLAP